MKCVSLICTYHGEKGLANVAGLHTILERIQPGVIFFEAPPVSSDNEFNVESVGTVESAAVVRYRINRSVVVEPVDLPTPDESFFRGASGFFNEIPRKSYEYSQLLDEHLSLIATQGFPYLNSERQSKFQSSLHGVTLEWLARVNNSEFSRFYDLWIKTNDQRDQAMIINIERYCREHEFERAVFLVGAAHRESIIEKTKRQSIVGHELVSWDYSGDGAW